MVWFESGEPSRKESIIIKHLLRDEIMTLVREKRGEKTWGKKGSFAKLGKGFF